MGACYILLHLNTFERLHMLTFFFFNFVQLLENSSPQSQVPVLILLLCPHSHQLLHRQAVLALE